jgi:micrococcal nuclease
MYEYKAIIKRVVDADTVDVSVDLGFDVSIHQRVRLLGLNAAEKNTELGQEAIEYVDSVLPVGKEILLRSEKDKREKFGRYLANIVFIETGECLNQTLIEKNYAVEYWGKGKKEDFVPKKS